MPAPDTQPAWVRMLQDALENYPAETVTAYILLDIASMGGMYQLLSLTGAAEHITADFVVAFAISRLLRRFRLPVDLAAAGLVAKLYPPLTQVQVSRAWTSPAATGGATAAAHSSSSSSAGGGGGGGALRRWGRSLKALIDRYGLAFLVAQRMVMGPTAVFTIYAALRAGVDVQSLLSGWGGAAAGSTGAGAGVWAASALGASLLFPGVLLGSGAIGRTVGKLRKGV